MAPKRKQEGSSRESPPKKVAEKKLSFFQQVVDEAMGAEKALDAPETEADESKWIETLALHLAHCPRFIEWCKSGTEPTEVIIQGWWLAAIHLPGRWNKYDTMRSFTRKWWDGLRNTNNRLLVVQRAQEILTSLVDVKNTNIDNVTAPAPASTPVDQANREQLFRLHSTRQKLVGGIASLTEAQHAVSRMLQDAIVQETSRVGSGQGSAHSQRYNDIVEELGLLEQVKQDFRDTLNASALNQVAIRTLDDLLETVPENPDNAKLFTVHRGTEQTETLGAAGESSAKFEHKTLTESSVGDIKVPTIAEIRKMVEEAHDFKPNYLSALVTEEKLSTTVLQVRRRHDRDEAFQAAQVIDVQEAPKFLDPDAMKKADIICADWLKNAANSFNKELFKTAFRDFEATRERPDVCRKAPIGDHLWIWKKGQHLMVAKDNIYHIRYLIQDLCEQGLLRESIDGENMYAKLQQALRRMWALLSLMCGCFGDVDLLLTATDKLLEDLAGLFVGTMDVRMETIAMQNVVRAISEDQSRLSRSTSKFVKTPEILETHHRVRLAFTEIATLYRGAVVLLISHFFPGAGTKAQRQTWYSNLLKLFNECGHPNCREQIHIKRMNWGGRESKSKDDAAKAKAKAKRGGKQGKTDESDELISDGAEDKALEEEMAEAKAKPEGKDREREKWSISIAVKDARIGWPDQRAHISDNRPFAYPCLSNLVDKMAYNAALGLVMHYFGHVYHPACRPFRGKYGLVDDLKAHLQGSPSGLELKTGTQVEDASGEEYGALDDGDFVEFL